MINELDFINMNFKIHAKIVFFGGFSGVYNNKKCVYKVWAGV